MQYLRTHIFVSYNALIWLEAQQIRLKSNHQVCSSTDCFSVGLTHTAYAMCHLTQCVIKLSFMLDILGSHTEWFQIIMTFTLQHPPPTLYKPVKQRSIPNYEF